MWIFRAWTTAPDGSRVYPKNGKKAVKIWVGPKNLKASSGK